MKILCVCEHGNIRSVALAYILKTLFNHEAIAVGWERITPETFNMLDVWADLVITMIEPPKEYKNHPKLIFIDVGKDVWKDAHAQGLTHKLYKELAKHPELWKKEINQK